jgi:predicted nucleic acid-binding protein
MAETLVADASLWLALILREIQDDAWVNRLSDDLVIAPDLLPYELANGIMRAHRRQRIDVSPSSNLLIQLPNLEVTWLEKSEWWEDAIRMARKQNVTIYDAAYMAVAKQSGAILCSLDQKQLSAAQLEGIAVLSSPK